MAMIHVVVSDTQQVKKLKRTYLKRKSNNFSSVLSYLNTKLWAIAVSNLNITDTLAFLANRQLAVFNSSIFYTNMKWHYQWDELHLEQGLKCN